LVIRIFFKKLKINLFLRVQVILGKRAFIRDFQLWLMKADGSNPTQITFEANGEGFNRYPAWRPY